MHVGKRTASGRRRPGGGEVSDAPRPARAQSTEMQREDDRASGTSARRVTARDRCQTTVRQTRPVRQTAVRQTDRVDGRADRPSSDRPCVRPTAVRPTVRQTDRACAPDPATSVDAASDTDAASSAASSATTPKTAATPSIHARCSPARACSRERTMGSCSSTPAMCRKRGLGASVVVAARSGAGDLGVEDVEDVLAQGHDGGRDVVGVAGLAEAAGRLADELACGVGGAELFERGVDADGLEVEQFDAGHLDDVGGDVARQAEVDDELARVGGGRGRRARSARNAASTDPVRCASTSIGAPASSSTRSTTWCSTVRAGDDDVGGSGGEGVVGIGARPRCRGSRRSRLPRPEGEYTRTSVAPRSRSAASEAPAKRPVPTSSTRARRPVGDAALGEVECEAHERTARGADAGARSSPCARSARRAGRAARGRGSWCPRRAPVRATRRTWPAISPSPTTTDSSPDATAKRCPATALPCTKPKVARSSSGSRPAASRPR